MTACEEIWLWATSNFDWLTWTNMNIHDEEHSMLVIHENPSDAVSDNTDSFLSGHTEIARTSSSEFCTRECLHFYSTPPNSIADNFVHFGEARNHSELDFRIPGKFSPSWGTVHGFIVILFDQVLRSQKHLQISNFACWTGTNLIAQLFISKISGIGFSSKLVKTTGIKAKNTRPP